jgi:16S rRNA (guanine966-N2)-methyltransferase
MAKQRPAQHNQKKGSKNNNQLRIIGGSWRGRKLAFPSIEGLRPTPDRVRETLFNWLTAVVPGARCLDLFAGSGALSFEALSRGALHADLVEASAEAAKQLNDNTALLAANARVWQTKAEAAITQLDPGYNIIFLDPPFHQSLLSSCITLIEQHQLLAEQAWVYIETASDESLPLIPPHWQLHREKHAGQVSYRLFSVNKL